MRNHSLLVLVYVAILYYITLVTIYFMHLIILKKSLYISPNALVACELLLVHYGLLSCVLADNGVESLLMSVCTN